MSRRLGTAATLLLAGFLLVHPLAFDVRALFPWDTGGSFFVRPKLIVLFSAAGVATLLLVAEVVRQWPPGGLQALRRRPAVVAWLASIALMGIAPLLATETPTSLGYLGFSFRGDGVLLFVASMLLAASAAWFAAGDRRVVDVGIAAFAAGATIVAAIALLQAQGAPFWGWLGLARFDRGPPSATLGNTAFVSALTASATALLAHVAVAPRVRRDVRRLVPVLAMLAANGAATMSTGSRAAMAGLILVLGISLVVAVVRAASVRGAAYALAIGGLVVVVLGVGIATSSYGRGKLQSLVATVTGMREDGDRNVSSRLLFMRIAGRAIGQQPVRPHGVASFTIVSWRSATEAQERALIRLYLPEASVPTAQRRQNVLRWTPPGSDEPRTRPIYIDKVHNYVLDAWIAYGGAATLALIAWVALVAWRLLRARTTATLGILAAAGVFAIYAQAWFPTPAVDPLLFTLLGIGWGAAERARPLPEPAVADTPKGDRSARRRRARRRRDGGRASSSGR